MNKKAGRKKTIPPIKKKRHKPGDDEVATSVIIEKSDRKNTAPTIDVRDTHRPPRKKPGKDSEDK